MEVSIEWPKDLEWLDPLIPLSDGTSSGFKYVAKTLVANCMLRLSENPKSAWTWDPVMCRIYNNGEIADDDWLLCFSLQEATDACRRYGGEAQDKERAWEGMCRAYNYLGAAIQIQDGTAKVIEEARLARPDIERGRKIIQSAKSGHEALYGTEEEKKERRKSYQESVDACHREHPDWGITAIRSWVAEQFKVNPKTISRHTTNPKSKKV
jgi:hypothetical protein